MLDELLAEIARRKAERKGQLQPPCPPERIQRLRRRCLEHLKANLPEDYASLLGHTDGVDWNGTVFYASETSTIVGYSDRFIEGFVEANLSYRDIPRCERLLVFGESGMEFYAFALDKLQYQVTDQISLYSLEVYPSFEELFQAAYAKRLWPKGMRDKTAD